MFWSLVLVCRGGGSLWQWKEAGTPAAPQHMVKVEESKIQTVADPLKVTSGSDVV